MVILSQARSAIHTNSSKIKLKFVVWNGGAINNSLF